LLASAFFIYLGKNKKEAQKSIIAISLLLMIFIPLGLLLYTNVSVNPDLLNWQTIRAEFMERIDICRTQISAAYADNLKYLPIGRGKAVFLLRDESHNQYVRNFVDTGLIGVLISFGLILAILRKTISGIKSQGDSLKIALSIGIFVSTLSLLVLSLAAEAFLVVRINESYWYFVGLTMAILSLDNQD